MDVTSNAAFTVSYTVTAEIVLSFSSSQSSHPLGRKCYRWSEISSFYLGGNLWGLFSQILLSFYIGTKAKILKIRLIKARLKNAVAERILNTVSERN